MMKSFLVLILFLTYCWSQEVTEENALLTGNTVTDLSTCFDSSCNYDKTEEVTFVSDTEQTEKSTTKAPATTVVNKNTADAGKKSTVGENQSQDENKKEKGQKANQPEVPRKIKPKPKPKPKEDKSKIKLDKPSQNKTEDEKSDSKFNKKLRNFYNIKSCNCDAHSGVCEVNCCCDEDCTKENKKVFSHCEDESNYISKSDYCFSPNVIYKNNTPYKAFNLRPGLLCIAKDNLPDKIKYYTHKVIETGDNIEKVIKKRKIFHWKTTLENVDSDLDRENQYLYGSYVWIVRNSSDDLTLQKMSIIHEGVTSLCQGQYLVGYLENIETSCLVKFPKRDECIESFIYQAAPHIDDVYILKSPHLINSSTDLQEVSFEDVFIKVQNFICFNDNCTKSQILDFAKFNSRNNACNTIKKVSYYIRHNGTGGIVEARCFLHVKNLTLQSGMFRQEHEIKFDWITKVNTSFPRSGKPGYLHRKPLISGNRTEKTEDDRKLYRFNISNNPNEWITRIDASRDGFCKNQRTNIMFNENVRAECTLKIQNNDLNAAENCSIAHEKIMRYLFGKTELDTIWLSSWGDPNIDDVNSWVPLVMSNEELIPSCNQIITSVHYRFIYSLSGPIGSPQAKLIGASFVIDSKPFTCESSECLVKLVTTITFTSVTSTPQLLYPKHPALRIHLPKDFFYPFSSSSSKSSKLTFNNNVLVSSLLYVIVFLYFKK